jgi:hypothetical protein
LASTQSTVRREPLAPAARRLATIASSAIALAGIVGGAVRLLPWLLDPTVPPAAAAAFARTLVSAALEASILVGWPVGWALACVGAAERGEALVLQSLGESPGATVGRFTRGGAVLAAALSACSFLCGADATTPGRVASELVASARLACDTWPAAFGVPRSFAIPFTDMTWLCAPGHTSVIAGPVPGATGAFVVAHGARIGGDLRAVELDEAHVVLGREPRVAVRTAKLTIHGMTPWSHASTLPPAFRAAALSLTAWTSGAVAAYAALRGLIRSRASAIAVGALGPLVALSALRTLERIDAHAIAYAAVPIGALLIEGAALLAADRLRPRWPTARSKTSVWGRLGLVRRGQRDG